MLLSTIDQGLFTFVKLENLVTSFQSTQETLGFLCIANFIDEMFEREHVQ